LNPVLDQVEKKRPRRGGNRHLDVRLIGGKTKTTTIFWRVLQTEQA
jgi:hypothetical protein